MKRQQLTTFLAILIFLAVGQAYATQTVVLFDLSGSMIEGNDENLPFHSNRAELMKVIQKLEKSDSIVVLGFGKKADVVLLKATMPDQAGPMNRYLIATRQTAIEKLDENIKKKVSQVNTAGSGVLGGIFRASRMFHDLDAHKPRRLLIFSDMLDNEDLNLGMKSLSSGHPEKFFKRYDAKKIGYPDLKNIEVHVSSAFSDVKGLSTIETEMAIKALRTFWTDFFVRSGAVVKSYQTIY